MLPPLLGPPIVIQALVVERSNFRTACARAGTLLKGNWTRVPLYLFSVALAAGLVQLTIFGVLGQGLADASWLDSVLGDSLLAAVAAIVPALVLPYVAEFQLFCYLDLRARGDGLDTEMLRGEIANS
jgi:hypothetical protein